jgi:glutamate-1-semialdehyde 2,1-aminomutase
MEMEWSLMGTGTNKWEVALARLLCENIDSLDQVQITNTGSEATAHAIRLSRAFTGRDDIVLMMGGYNGWHNEVARAVMPSPEAAGERISCGEYPFISMSAGIPQSTKDKVHIINFNDLESLEYVLKKYPIACVMTEPCLQNIGVVPPQEGYLQSMITLCEQYGTVCVFDEVKTGFRTALGGYQGKHGLKPHLSVFGKAIANGYPLGVIGGKKEIMELFYSTDPSKRVLIAGTYNAHPFNTAASIATIEALKNDSVYEQLEVRTRTLVEGTEALFKEKGIEVTIARNGSAYCIYLMDHIPVDLHDILKHHDMVLDKQFRVALIEEGIYNIPIPCKQSSVSYSHSEEDIDKTLKATRKVLKSF